MKNIRKLAVIRDEDDACPFGLRIISDCLAAGESVDDMVLVEDGNQSAIDYNMIILNKNVEPKKCKYAAHIFKNKKHVVDCDFGDTAAGLSQEVSFVGSPYYTQVDKGVGIGGLLNYPVTYQTDGSEYRNIYYGIYNWASSRELKLALRLALLDTLKTRKS